MQEAGSNIYGNCDTLDFETVFDLLARQSTILLKWTKARQGATVQVVDRAIIPDRWLLPK